MTSGKKKSFMHSRNSSFFQSMNYPHQKKPGYKRFPGSFIAPRQVLCPENRISPGFLLPVLLFSIGRCFYSLLRTVYHGLNLTPDPLSACGEGVTEGRGRFYFLYFFFATLLLCCYLKDHSASNSSKPAPQTGQTQSSGRSSNGVPGGIPPSSSPSSGS